MERKQATRVALLGLVASAVGIVTVFSLWGSPSGTAITLGLLVIALILKVRGWY